MAVERAQYLTRSKCLWLVLNAGESFQELLQRYNVVVLVQSMNIYNHFLKWHCAYSSGLTYVAAKMPCLHGFTYHPMAHSNFTHTVHIGLNQSCLHVVLASTAVTQ